MKDSIKTSIIPIQQQFVGAPGKLNLRAICCFAATGFFLDDDTYFENVHLLRPAVYYEFGSGSKIVSGKPWFRWHYSPRNITLDAAVEEFSELFEQIVSESQALGRVILPLSGGLDSRTQAAALRKTGAKVSAYSYSFDGGRAEHEYGRRIADRCGFSFESWTVPNGYLWGSIGELARINGCYTEFTHPRQMAFIDRFSSLGDVFSLGHWGDVLFDNMNVDESLSLDEQVRLALKKIVRPGGVELGRALWESWGLSGDFESYLSSRLRGILESIDIPNSANARLRALKSLCWAPRWTSVNLGIFSSVRPIAVPYYDDRMCQFICTIPESYLANRRIQIEYLKRTAPDLASIPWQAHHPFNLYNYHFDRTPYNLPLRVISRLRRELASIPFVQRNWELQFRGERNRKELDSFLFDKDFNVFVPEEISRRFLQLFDEVDPVRYSHSVSILLTLSAFIRFHYHRHD